MFYRVGIRSKITIRTTYNIIYNIISEEYYYIIIILSVVKTVRLGATERRQKFGFCLRRGWKRGVVLLWWVEYWQIYWHKVRFVNKRETNERNGQNIQPTTVVYIRMRTLIYIDKKKWSILSVRYLSSNI